MKRDRQRWPALLVWGLVLALAVLHWDFWFWDDRTLVLGIVPIGLAYHMAFSVAAALTWTLAVRLIWPSDLEAWASEADDVPPRELARKGHR